MRDLLIQLQEEKQLIQVVEMEAILNLQLMILQLRTQQLKRVVQEELVLIPALAEKTLAQIQTPILELGKDLDQDLVKEPAQKITINPVLDLDKTPQIRILQLKETLTMALVKLQIQMETDQVIKTQTLVKAIKTKMREKVTLLLKMVPSLGTVG